MRELMSKDKPLSVSKFRSWQYQVDLCTLEMDDLFASGMETWQVKGCQWRELVKDVKQPPGTGYKNLKYELIYLIERPGNIDQQWL